MTSLALALLAGCPKKDEPTTPVAGTTSASSEDAAYKPITEQPTQDGLVVQSVDVDLDHQADIYNYFLERPNGGRQLVRKELDANRDGRVDTISYYGEDGLLEREEMDRDFDSRFDWTDHYRNKLRVESEVDTNNDGKMDVFSYYEGQPPKITRKERDTNGDGLIDYWERFDEYGLVTKTGKDIDGDGKMDIREE